jgi:hypothetical protein
MMRGVNNAQEGRHSIWDRNLYSAAMDDVKNMKCLMTLTDGEVVYGAPDAPVKVRSGTDSH